jgi:hypothetical protein
MGMIGKVVGLGVVVGVAAVGYVFWSDMDEGEQYHLVDKAKSGDAKGLADAVAFKADEAVERQKQKAAELARDAATKVVDEANASLKTAANQAIDQAANDAKAKIAGDGGVKLDAGAK